MQDIFYTLHQVQLEIYHLTIEELRKMFGKNGVIFKDMQEIRNIKESIQVSRKFTKTPGEALP